MTMSVTEHNRDLGRSFLSSVLSNSKNVDIIEKLASRVARNDDEYYQIITQVCREIVAKEKSLKNIVCDLKKRRYAWNHTSFAAERMREAEITEFIKTPFVVEEGIFPCKRCKSRRVFSYQKQTRSCDESATTFAQCSNCNSSWTYSG